MNVEDREHYRLVTMTYDERAELYAGGEHPPDRAIEAVAVQERLSADRLHCSEVRFGGEHDVEVVVRLRE